MIPFLDLVCIGCEFKVGIGKGSGGLELWWWIGKGLEAVSVVGNGDGAAVDGEDKLEGVDEDTWLGVKTDRSEGSTADCDVDELEGGFRGGIG